MHAVLEFTMPYVEKLTKPLTDSRVLVRTTFIGLFSSSLSFPFPLVCTTAQHPVRVLPTWLDKSPLPVQGVKYYGSLIM